MGYCRYARFLFSDKPHIRRIMMALSAGDKAKIIEEYRLEKAIPEAPSTGGFANKQYQCVTKSFYRS